MKKLLASAAAFAALLPAAAQAQTMPPTSFYLGGQVGYHDIGELDLSFIGGPDESVGGFIFGGYAGVEVPVSEVLFLGVEGNYNFGTEEIDSDYGITANVGTRFGDTGTVFGRVGYQWVDYDFGNLAESLAEQTADNFGLPPGPQRDEFIAGFLEGFDDSADTTESDFMFGVGAEFAVMDTAGVRVTADTISFDTIRVAAGYTFRF